MRCDPDVSMAAALCMLHTHAPCCCRLAQCTAPPRPCPFPSALLRLNAFTLPIAPPLWRAQGTGVHAPAIPAGIAGVERGLNFMVDGFLRLPIRDTRQARQQSRVGQWRAALPLGGSSGCGAHGGGVVRAAQGAAGVVATQPIMLWCGGCRAAKICPRQAGAPSQARYHASQAGAPWHHAAMRGCGSAGAGAHEKERSSLLARRGARLAQVGAGDTRRDTGLLPRGGAIGKEGLTQRPGRSDSNHGPAAKANLRALGAPIPCGSLPLPAGAPGGRMLRSHTAAVWESVVMRCRMAGRDGGAAGIRASAHIMSCTPAIRRDTEAPLLHKPLRAASR
jgi:hypothetical protein